MEQSIQPPDQRQAERLREMERQLEKFEDVRERLAEYNFQSITIILGIITIVGIIPFVLIHGYQIASGTVADGILAVLIADTAMAALWMCLWWRASSRGRNRSHR